MTIETDVQKLEPGAIVELFELDLTPFTGDLLRFHAGTNGLLANVTWNGNVYTRFPVAASGFEFTGQGQAPRPKLMASNIAGAITALVLQYEDLVGAKVTRRRTLAKYLDAVNFPAQRNLLTYSEQLWNQSGWAVGTTLASFYVATQSTDVLDIYSASGPVAKYVASASTAVLFLRKVQSIAVGTYIPSIYIYVPSQAGITNWRIQCDASDVDLTAQSSLSTQFGQWVRVQVPALTATATRTFLDFNIIVNGSIYAPPTGFTFYASGAQFELASVASDYQFVGATWSQNPTADPSAEFPHDIFYIDRKSVETSEIVEFELAPAMDITGVMLPRRQIIQNICPWRYRGSECGYTGTTYFDVTDVPVGSAGLDVCGKRLTSCKLRFGQYAELPFGGFPVAGLFR